MFAFKKPFVPKEGDPLTRDELVEMIELLVRGAHGVKDAVLPLKTKYSMLQRQYTCLQLIITAPDLVREEIYKARGKKEANEQG